jgi:hypothetical protein
MDGWLSSKSTLDFMTATLPNPAAVPFPAVADNYLPLVADSAHAPAAALHLLLLMLLISTQCSHLSEFVPASSLLVLQLVYSSSSSAPAPAASDLLFPAVAAPAIPLPLLAGADLTSAPAAVPAAAAPAAAPASRPVASASDLTVFAAALLQLLLLLFPVFSMLFLAASATALHHMLSLGKHLYNRPMSSPYHIQCQWRHKGCPQHLPLVQCHF